MELVELAGFDGGGRVPTAIAAQKRFALGIEAGQGLRAGEVGEVIAALAVLGFVIDDAVFHFHLAGVEVALEVGGVVLGIPQTELDARRRRRCVALVARRLVTVSCQISRFSSRGTK